MSNRQERRFQLAEPIVRTDRLLFERSHAVEFELGLPGVAMHVTTDGSEPTTEAPAVTGPVVLHESATMKVRAFHADWAPSDVVTREFYRIRSVARHVDLLTKPDVAYPGKGADTLLDLRGGTSAFGDGSWLGFRESDLLATLDLGVATAVEAVLVGTLANNGSWIFLPSAVAVETSVDGSRFDSAVSRTFAEPASPEADGQRFLRVELASERGSTATARYLRVLVGRRRVLPRWHAAAGSPAWLFVDTIAVL
jgi:hypothetical protein